MILFSLVAFNFKLLPSLIRWSGVFLALSLLAGLPTGIAQEFVDVQTEPAKCVMIELYISENQAASDQASAAAKHFAESRPGIRLVTRSITDNKKAHERLRRIANYFRFDEKTTPVIYCCNTVIRHGVNADDFERQLKAAHQIVVYTRQGCSRCANAKKYLPTLMRRYPGLEIVYRDISYDLEARNDLNDLVRQYRQAATSTPVFHFFNKMIVGFDRPETTGARIQQELERWSTNCPITQPLTLERQSFEFQRSTAREVVVEVPF